MARDIKVTVICNNCNKQVKTTMSNIKPCSCGIVDYEILDDFDVMLNKYAEERNANRKKLACTNIR
jgi:Zn finger protein HypA/HybF involved in hydrogenase expression